MADRPVDGAAADPSARAAILGDVGRYYGDKIRRHGATPSGVDWTCEMSQRLRFAQLVKVCDFDTAGEAPVSINDLGCGYGALLAHLDDKHPEAQIDYLGVDVAPEMIEAARRLWRGRAGAAFAVGEAPERRADYTLTSGVFNVTVGHARAAWERHIASTLRLMASVSRKGIAFNLILMRPGDPEEGPLHHADPDQWAAFMEDDLGWRAETLRNYGQPEATILARP